MESKKIIETPFSPNSFELTLKEEEAFDDPSSFQCCVCLDLLYKPVVLACGHGSCFWCVHKAMHGLRASHCPMCRQPYIHFPSICQLLHRLILKLEPVAYKRRESEVLEEETRVNIFSPQFGDSLIPDNSGIPEEIARSLDLKASTVPLKEPSFPTQKQICVDDVSCELCKELLFKPATLNCGHVFCKSCLIEQGNEPLKCPVCQSLHLGGFPKICFDLDHFLEEQFPKEYETRRVAVQLKQAECRHVESSSSSTSEEKKKTDPPYSKEGFFSDEDLHNVHVGVGCDSCGIYPIIGKRYKCEDCEEAIGFDLCEACYNSSSKRPGRFNQRHTPNHKFRLDDSQILAKILLRSLQPHADQGSDQAIDIPEDTQQDHDDSPEDEDHGIDDDDNNNNNNNNNNNVPV